MKKEMLPKSPLRYPGGKSRAVTTIINECIPIGVPTLCSPFVGGGSVELALASRGTRVYAYDSFAPLVAFWRSLIEDAPSLAHLVGRYRDMNPALFYGLQKELSDFCTASVGGVIPSEKLPLFPDDAEIAAIFYAVNRSSFSGTTLSGGMSPGHPRFTDSAVERILKFKIQNFTVELSDFKNSMPKHGGDFLYCDPPYLIPQKLYGNKGDRHTGFDHEWLRDLLVGREGWVLSYNDCEAIRAMYEGHATTTPSWSYGMGAKKESKELLIFSKDYIRVPGAG